MKAVSRFHGPVFGAQTCPKSVPKIRIFGAAGHGFAGVRAEARSVSGACPQPRPLSRTGEGRFAALTSPPGHGLRNFRRAAASCPAPEPFDAASRQNDDDDASPRQRRDEGLNAPVRSGSSPGGAPGSRPAIAGRSRGGLRARRNFRNVRLQGRDRRRHRQCRPRDALDPRRAPLSRVRGRRARFAQLDRQGGVVRRPDAEVQGARALRLFRCRHLPDVGRRDGVEGIFAEDRRQGLRRHRQFLGLADGSGRAAGRARGQRRRGQGLRQEVHHRQPELLDRPARRGAEAAARPRDDQAGGGRDLSVGLRRRQGGDGRALLADPGGVRLRSARTEEVPQAHRLQPHPPDRRLHGRRARPRKSGR